MSIRQLAVTATLMLAVAGFSETASARFIQPDPIGLQGGMNPYAYVQGDPILQIDPLGLANGPAVGWMNISGSWTTTLLQPRGTPSPVYICSRAVNLSWLPSSVANVLPQHFWIQTPTASAGMGGACPTPGQQCSDIPYSNTQVTNQSTAPGAPGVTCVPQYNVNTACVNGKLAIGAPTGTWSAINNCQTFAVGVVNSCRGQ